jgi:error-prone DNA polymerase
MGRPRFAHLSVRSTFSFKEGAIRPEDLGPAVRRLGMDAVALTDTNSLAGAVRFVRGCRAAGVKPILGARVTVEAGAGRQVVTLLAATREGYTNLCRILTAAHHRGERGDPCAAFEDLADRAAGLVALLGPGSEVGRLAVRGRQDEAEALLGRWREAFGRRLRIEVRNLLEPSSGLETARLLRLADARRIPAVATNDVRILAPADAFLADVLDAMRKLVPLADHHRDNTNAEMHLKTPAEMAALHRSRPDVVAEAARLAEACEEVDLGLGALHLPRYPLPAGTSPDAALARRAREGIARRGLAPSRALLDRLEAELAVIARLGLAGYFLHVADIVARIRARGIRVACRGSAAGSLVCHLLGISEVDPLAYGLLFERFVNPYRRELPDIDLDVESARREEVYADLLAAFSPERVACVAMVDTYRARGAIREVGKALGYPEGELDLVAKAFPHVEASGIRAALERLPELRRTTLGRGQLDLLFAVAERLDGFPRHLALHPSGILIAPDDLTTRAPLERSAEGFRLVQLDKDDVEALGLLKLDVIGVRMLSAMTHAVREVERTTGERIDLDRIPRDDEATFELIRASRTLGCFQIESPGQRELLGKLQPTRFEDLIADISLFRPGPVRSDMVTPYLNRRLGLAPPAYPHPALRPHLQESFGVIVFHEQVMRVVAAVTGVDLGRADQVRRDLEDEERLAEVERWFRARGRARGFTEAEIAAVWREVSSFAAFGFAKAHAAAFAVPTYQSAWLKAHHPAAFYAGVLTHEPGMYPRRAILEDARREGVPVLPLDVNASERAYTVEPGPDGRPGVRIGLMHVDGISAAEIDRILAARAERPFDSLADLCRRAAPSRPTVERLVHVGALDAFGGRRDLLLEVGERWAAGAPREAPGQAALPVGEARLPAGLRPYSDAERVRAELEVTGLDVSRHVLSFYEGTLARLGVTRAAHLRRHRQGARVMVAGVKVASQTPAVRSGQRIIFLTLGDPTGLVDVTVFEGVQERCAWTVFHAWLLVVRGTLRKTGVGGASVVCERAWDLATLARADREGRLDPEALWAEEPDEVPAAAPAPRRLWHASAGSAGA